MTFAIFIILFLGLFIAVLNVLPVADTISTNISSSITLVIGYMKAWDFLFPITEILICVGLVTTFYLVIWLWHALKYVMSVIRGNQSGS